MTLTGEQQRISRRLTEKSLRLRMLLEERGLNISSVFYEYESAVRKRLEE
ncbi:hypothetical protein ACWHAM_25920 [Paenibacillus terrae]|uniref:Uncharacterized protein n=1 Tax=Paenibacillus terrae (strain HPL-003) TaxID=985665 RepID=G7W131_PAETH|nr:hypothetical protein [Paenibacillus terrae]AET60520.1 hypothetical protein HPL003_18890 [Paenibacillus terrae HPL-003]